MRTATTVRSSARPWRPPRLLLSGLRRQLRAARDGVRSLVVDDEPGSVVAGIRPTQREPRDLAAEVAVGAVREGDTRVVRIASGDSPCDRALRREAAVGSRLAGELPGERGADRTERHADVDIAAGCTARRPEPERRHPVAAERWTTGHAG